MKEIKENLFFSVFISTAAYIFFNWLRKFEQTGKDKSKTQF